MKRTVLRFVEDMWRGRRRIRVVVLGSAKSGKTVFLTALAGHLKNHDKTAGRFDLRGWEASLADDAPSRGGRSLPAFPFAEYLNGLRKPIPEFPAKTTVEMSVLRLPLVLEKADGRSSRRREVLLELLDLPGERVADLAMASKDYCGWCAWMNRAFGEERASGSYRAYLASARAATSAEALFKAYREHLVREFERLSPWITPSVVKVVDGDARRFREKVWERPLGVDAASQFVPLPDEAFGKTCPLNRFAKEFSQAYGKYREAIVKPLADWLGEADHLVYLVDVLGTLQRGLAAYNAELVYGTDVLGMFRKTDTRMPVLGPLWDCLAGLFRTRVKSAALVATKADLVYGRENRDRLRGLARQLLGKAVRGLGLGEREDCYRVCSAMKTVRDASEEGAKRTFVARLDAASAAESEYFPADVPERWPSNPGWAQEAGACFARPTYPPVDMRENAVPEQIGLDDLVCAILNLKG